EICPPARPILPATRRVPHRLPVGNLLCCLVQTKRQTQGGREERVSTVFRCRPERPSGLHLRSLPLSSSYWLRVRLSVCKITPGGPLAHCRPKAPRPSPQSRALGKLCHDLLVQPDVHFRRAIESAGVAEFLRQLLAGAKAAVQFQ